MNRGGQRSSLVGRWKSFLLDRRYTLRGDADAAENPVLWQTPLLALIAFALVMGGVGAVIYLSAKRSVTQSTHDNLQTIAKLKSGEIERWLDDHGKDAQLSINTPLFTNALQHWLNGGMRDSAARERLLEHLKKMAMAGYYRDVSVRAVTDGGLLLSSSGRVDVQSYRANALTAAREMKTIFDDTSPVSAVSADADLDFYVPITPVGMSQPLGVVHIQDSASGFLFPQLGRWPGAVSSSEILLFRSDGQHLFFLKNPRRLSDNPLRLRLTLTDTDLLSTQAALGQLGPLLGVDYSGVQSLGYALPVAGTTWLLLATVDAAEAYAWLNTVAFYRAAFAFILLFSAMWWVFARNHQAESRYRHYLHRELLARRVDFLSKNANDIMILTDLNGAIIEVNDRFSAVYGYSHEATIGMDVAELSAPGRRDALPWKMKRLMARECLVYETENVHEDGHVFPVESSARMIEIDGKCYFQWIVRDVTERKRMETALRASEERFRQAFDHAPIGMAMVGMDGRFLTVNSEICRFTGYGPGELTAMTVSDITYPVDQAESGSLRTVHDAGADQFGPTVKMAVHKEGRILYLSINRTLIRSSDGGALYVLYQIQDITERKEASARIQRLSQLKAAISETNRAIIHSGCPAEVYRAVCQASVEHGCFWLAWVGIADPDTQSITPVEVAGPASGYLDGAVISARSDIPEGQWPSAMAYRERRVYVCNDFSDGPVNVPWRDRAAAYCLSSSIALPILRGGKPYGSLTVYGPEKNLFDDESEALLRAMAENISFAIDHFDRETQRRQSEIDLRHSEEKFRTLVENLPQSVFVKDSGSVYVSCNIAYARMLGITPDKISGMTDFDFYPKELAEKYRIDDRKVLDSGEVEDIHEEHIEQGQQRFVHTIKAPVRNDRGEIVGVLGMLSDVTERKRAEIALKQYADEVDDLYQNAPCGYHSIASDGTLLRINNTELRWLGYTSEEVVCRMNILDILAPASRHAFIESFSQFKKTGVMQEHEVEMLRKDRTTLPVVLSATAVFDADGRYVFSRTTVFDITERRKLEADQRKQAKRLEDLSYRLVAVQEEERRRLAAELHDRASPNLAAIKITFGALADSLPAAVLADVESCLADVRALLDDTTVGIREICTELRPTVLDYAGLISALEGYAAQFMKRTGVVVCVKAQQDATRLAKNIESVLFRIVQEALTNCAKHACAKKIIIELVNADRQVSLTIKDDGFGFNPDALGQSGQVSGLGLITMRERAEFVGGKFSITSHPLMGTEIRVELSKQNESGNEQATPLDFEKLSAHLLPGPSSLN